MTTAAPRKATKGKTEAGEASASPEELRAYLREMLVIRRFEEKAGQLYGMGLIAGFCHLYIGQEAVVTGVVHALEKGDTMVTGYRCHGHMLATGANPRAVFAELAGRATGVGRGKGGSMHMFNVAAGFYGGHAIVGAQVPLGTGLAFAHKYRGGDRVSVVFFGEGAANQGQVYEAFNMASLWRLPAIFLIENNRYAMGTEIRRAKAGAELFERGVAFGIPGEQVDGMDVLAVKEAAERAVRHGREGKGPALLEMMTYRYRGHSMSDPGKYRTKDEVSKVRAEQDSIEHVRRLLLDGGASEDELKEIDRAVKTLINEAAAFAQDSPGPDPAELETDVYREA
ncbi:MAG TPA: pyruvate dehydrogenase (acetyl-transferring) E1 component subunit alpha [Alphaproteobacteria bacterium]|nr:pyruvate dehydrogenase (acetyl-transferring) E1 component subunit alpha [Alphaproteobacteria bacterium]